MLTRRCANSSSALKRWRIGPRIVAARIALAAFNRMKIMGILGIAYGQPPFMVMAMPLRRRGSGRHTVEHVDAAGDAFEQAVGVPTPIR